MWPPATAAKVPHIICSIPTIGDGRYNYTNIPLAEDEAEAWVAEAKARGLRTIAILAQKYASVDGHVNALKVAASAAGMQVVYEYRFPAGTTDFLKPMMAAGARPRRLFRLRLRAVADRPRQADPGGREGARQGPQRGVHRRDLARPGPRIFEGAWYTDSDLPRPEVFEQFLKAFPASELITHMMPYAYDSVRIFVDGIESDEGLVSYLQNLTSTTARTASSPVNPAVAISAPRRSSGWSRTAAPGQATGRTRPGCAPASDPDADASQPANRTLPPRTPRSRPTHTLPARTPTRRSRTGQAPPVVPLPDTAHFRRPRQSRPAPSHPRRCARYNGKKAPHLSGSPCRACGWRRRWSRGSTLAAAVSRR